jgi:hypothetical protein
MTPSELLLALLLVVSPLPNMIPAAISNPANTTAPAMIQKLLFFDVLIRYNKQTNKTLITLV